MNMGKRKRRKDNQLILFLLVILVIAVFLSFYGNYFLAGTISPRFTVFSSSGNIAQSSGPGSEEPVINCGEHQLNPDGSCLAVYEIDLTKSGHVMNWDYYWNSLLLATEGKSTGNSLDIRTLEDPNYIYYLSRSFVAFDTSDLPLNAVVTKAEIEISQKSGYKGKDDEFYFLKSTRTPPLGSVKKGDYIECGPVYPKDQYSVSKLINLKYDMPINNKKYKFSISPSTISAFGYTDLCARTWYDTYNIEPDSGVKFNSEALITLNHYKYGADLKPKLHVTYYKDENTHTECDQNYQCVVINSPGKNQCLDNSDCYHTECQSMQCVSVPGFDQDQCETNEDCWHWGCQNMQCVVMPYSGEDKCTENSDCYYYGCNFNDQCVKFPGQQGDECKDKSDCYRLLVFATQNWTIPLGKDGNDALNKADAFCNDEAKNRGYAGTYVAWLSISTQDAKDRIPDVRYKNVYNQLVANNKSDLLDGLINPIETQTVKKIWTGTLNDGSFSGENCQDWTVTANSWSTIGDPICIHFWSDLGQHTCGGWGLPLYCFQVA
jgi:hypothetical protein